MSKDHTALLEAFLEEARAQEDSIIAWRSDLTGHLRNIGLNLTPLFCNDGTRSYLDPGSVDRYLGNMSSAKSRIFLILKGAGLNVEGHEKEFYKRIDGCLLLFENVLQGLKNPKSAPELHQEFERGVNLAINSIIDFSLTHFGLTEKKIDQIRQTSLKDIEPIAGSICGEISSHFILSESLANEIAEVMGIDDTNWGALNDCRNHGDFAQSVFEILHSYRAIPPQSREPLKENLKTEIRELAMQFEMHDFIDPEDAAKLMHDFSWHIVDMYFPGNLPSLSNDGPHYDL